MVSWGSTTLEKARTKQVWLTDIAMLNWLNQWSARYRCTPTRRQNASKHPTVAQGSSWSEMTQHSATEPLPRMRHYCPGTHRATDDTHAACTSAYSTVPKYGAVPELRGNQRGAAEGDTAGDCKCDLDRHILTRFIQMAL